MKDYLSLKKPLVMLAVQILASLSGITLLFIIQLNNFLLFHYIVETFSILIALLIFAVTWSGRDIIDNKSIIFLGIAYLFVAILGSFHLISTEGMGILNMTNPNHSIQIWISARYIEATSILLVSIGVKKFYPKLTFLVYLAVTSLILLGIYKWQIFPVCYSTGAGLTDFKIISEYIFIGILFCSLIFFLYHRRNFQENFILLFSVAIIITIFSEFCFTLYTSVYDFVNGLGHILKIIYFLFIYKAIFVEGIHNPQQFLFQKISTKQIEISRKLKDSENIYQTLLENLPYYVFILNRDSNYVLCNSSYCQFAQREKSEIIGKNIFDVHPKWIADKYYQENLEFFEKGTPIEYEDKVIIAKKETFIKTKKMPIIDDGKIVGILGIFQDITEQKKIETELEEYRQHLEELVAEKTSSLESTNHRLLETISEYQKTKQVLHLHSAMIENIAEGIYLIGMDDLIIKWTNERFTKMFGYAPGEMIGKSIDIVNAPTERTPKETRISIIDILKETGEWHGEVKNIKKNGTHFWCYASVSIFAHPEYGDVIVSVHTDISEQKQTMINLTLARDEAESANRAKSNFLANMSHDFRTPLNAILGNTQIFLQDTELMLQYGRSINMIHKNSLHILSMINDILEFSEIDSGKIGSTDGREENRERNRDKKTDITTLIIPPKEVLLRFLELEKVGDIMGIVKLTDEIEQDNDDYVTFAKNIKELTELYQLEQFVVYINSFLDKGVK